MAYDFECKHLTKPFDNGEPISTLSAKQLADSRFDNIGFIFQQFHLIQTLTALENIMAPLFGGKVDYDGEQRDGRQRAPKTLGHVVNQKKVEKRFRLVLGTTANPLVVGIISLFVFTSPEVRPVTEEATTSPAPTAQTTGAKQADLKEDKTERSQSHVNARIKLTVFARYDFTLLPKNQNRTPID